MEFNDKTKELIEKIRVDILKEYDEMPDLNVVVRLMPTFHNTTNEVQKEINVETGKIEKVVYPQNKHEAKAYIIVHETTPGPKEGSMPTKPPEEKADWGHYDKLIHNSHKNYGYGGSVGYHALVGSSKNMLINGSKGITAPFITIYLPSQSSPDQLKNTKIKPYIYGIERLCGDEQNYHLNVAIQAMLSAYVLKQLGYKPNEVNKHVSTHKWMSIDGKDCPARMLYASKLLEKTKEGESLTDEEEKIIEEYVPWEVFSKLVRDFAERDRYPAELKKKFILDELDQIAYEKDPDGYDYEKRMVSKEIKVEDPLAVGQEIKRKTNIDAEDIIGQTKTDKKDESEDFKQLKKEDIKKVVDQFLEDKKLIKDCKNPKVTYDREEDRD